jgi:very-short-patch-repair endonuclease
MYYGASAKLFEYAKAMREAPTEAEKVVWDILYDEPFLQYKFRRQHPIARFIADFYSHQLKLVIEIDGGIHLLKEQKEYDDFRDEEMQAFGIAVIRLSNNEVLKDFERALAKIRIEIARCQYLLLKTNSTGP